MFDCFVDDIFNNIVDECGFGWIYVVVIVVGGVVCCSGFLD